MLLFKVQKMSFSAYRILETEGVFSTSLVDAEKAELPEGDLLVRVHHTSLNYKDVLSYSGHRGITKKFPHTPGIDAAGVVEECSSGDFKVGDEVIVTGFDLGMNTWGGHSQYIRVPSNWAVKKPEGLSLDESMIMGTAGFTAGQSILRMQDNGLKAGDGPILVTGATGGVGSMAVLLLSHLGYEVAAATRNPDHAEFLKSIGASEIVSSTDLVDSSDRPLLKSRWAGVVETVGGPLLETAVRSTQRRGVVTFCGMIASPELNLTVFPFILRGLRLIGIDSAECPLDQKISLWEKLSGSWKPENLRAVEDHRAFDEIPAMVDAMKAGSTRGRVTFNLPV